MSSLEVVTDWRVGAQAPCLVKGQTTPAQRIGGCPRLTGKQGFQVGVGDAVWQLAQQGEQAAGGLAHAGAVP
jgi:hypothetical protein